MSSKSTLDRSELVAQDEVGPAFERALAIVDEALAGFAGRELISGDAVMDRLLDLRSALAAESFLHGLEALERTPS